MAGPAVSLPYAVSVNVPPTGSVEQPSCPLGIVCYGVGKLATPNLPSGVNGIKDWNPSGQVKELMQLAAVDGQRERGATGIASRLNG